MLGLGDCFAESILTILRQLASQPGPTSDEQTEEKVDPVLKGQQLDIETKDRRLYRMMLPVTITVFIVTGI